MRENDVVRDSARAGRLVVWEEAPRDGAQAKTLMSAEARLAIAERQGAMFGADGPRHVIFTAGFPSICREEFEITRRVAPEASEVSPTCVCRGSTSDIDTAIAAMRGAVNGRLMFFVPISEATAFALTKKPASASVKRAVEMVAYALEHADGLAVDMAFVDAPRADRRLLTDAVDQVAQAGAATVMLADTVGECAPGEIFDLFSQVANGTGEQTVLVAHLHNDLGLGLANALEAIRAGCRVVASSWLGLGERSGMVCTAQLVFLLAYAPERLVKLIGTDAPVWWTEPDLPSLPKIARAVSELTGVPLKVTDPIVGSGVSTISTGTPFIDRGTFQPYDPEKLLGMPPQVVLTQLASARVVRAAAEDLGIPLSDEQVRSATAWVKAEAFRRGQAVIPDEDFQIFAAGLRATEA